MLLVLALPRVPSFIMKTAQSPGCPEWRETRTRPDISWKRLSRDTRSRAAPALLVDHLAAVAAMAVTASLGRWQLSRAARSRPCRLPRDASPALGSAPGQRAGGLPSKAAAHLHRPVRLQGRWLPQHTRVSGQPPDEGQARLFCADAAAAGRQRHGGAGAARLGAPQFSGPRALPRSRRRREVVSLPGGIAPPPRLYEFTGADLRRGLPHPAKSGLGRVSAPKPACRCGSVTVVQTGEPASRACSATGPSRAGRRQALRLRISMVRA
jgi:surfeit locus 1 family protein